jgi:hypothetical protein
MKTRNGFVSNSSSSSFVVNRYDDLFASKNHKMILTPKQIRQLKKNGFKLEMAYFPNQVSRLDNERITGEGMKYANYTKSVICNQDDELIFLIENRISFMADVHYENESWIYDGKSDTLIIAQNLGKQAQMGGSDKLNFGLGNREPVVKMTGKEYLEKQ